MREVGSPRRVIGLMDSKGQTHLSARLKEDIWVLNGRVKHGVKEGGISPGTLFNFHMNEVIQDFFNVPAGWTLNCSKFILLWHTGDLVLVQNSSGFKNFAEWYYRQTLYSVVPSWCNKLMQYCLQT